MTARVYGFGGPDAEALAKAAWMRDQARENKILRETREQLLREGYDPRDIPFIE